MPYHDVRVDFVELQAWRLPEEPAGVDQLLHAPRVDTRACVLQHLEGSLSVDDGVEDGASRHFDLSVEVGDRDEGFGLDALREIFEVVIVDKSVELDCIAYIVLWFELGVC